MHEVPEFARVQRPGDLTPAIRRWYEESGFEELSFEPVPDSEGSVGVMAYRGESVPLVPQQLFDMRAAGERRPAAQQEIQRAAEAVQVGANVHAAGVADIEVRMPDGRSATLPDAFTYVNSRPTYSGVLPTKGSYRGGTTVTVRGNYFMPGITVTIGGRPASNVQVVSATKLTAVTPPSPFGPTAQSQYASARSTIASCGPRKLA